MTTTVLRKARKLEGRRTFQGLSISVETAAGSSREWFDPLSGEAGETKMLYDYGYVRGTLGTDGDHIDVYVGPNETATHAFVITQMRRPKTPEGRAGVWKTVDEQKVMLGFDSPAEAKIAYLAHYNDPRFFGSMDTMPMESFKRAALASAGKGNLLRSPTAPSRSWLTPARALYHLPMFEPYEGQGRRCKNCVSFAKRDEACVIHERGVHVTESHVCGYHIPGAPRDTYAIGAATQPVLASLSGLEWVGERGASCGNCEAFDGQTCARIVTPSLGRYHVDALGCCALWSRTSEQAKS